MDEATAILGVDWEREEPRYGMVYLTLVDVADPDAFDHSGRTVLSRCRKYITVWRHAPAIAHELGHALGLDHVCEAPCPPDLLDNLMNGEVIEGTDLTDEQLHDIEKGRRRLTACR